MHIQIHSKYKNIRKDIENIPNGNYENVHTICNKRNTVEIIKIQQHTFVLKKYKSPNLANRIIYTFFRKSKAQHAYENALKILRRGIRTPFPVAFIEIKKKNIFKTGYFISEYMNYPTLEEWKNNTTEEDKNIKKDFIDFTIDLHKKNILPLDYNPKNIFIIKNTENDHYEFALTDINRAKFNNISTYRDPMRSFEQLGLKKQQLFSIVIEYTQKRYLDFEISLFILLYYRIKKRIQKFIKTCLKNI